MPKQHFTFCPEKNLLLLVAAICLLCSACGIYTFKDVSIPPEIKTVKLNFIENKARYVNPQLSPRLTNRLQEKIVNQTRLVRSGNDDADWVIGGTITQYDVTTSAITGEVASNNRLTVGVHVVVRDNKLLKDQEYDVTKSFEFSAQRTLQEAEVALADDIIRGLSDEIFNRLFSNW
jgi:outer membrane lipopolysaccharide assembly protein LptE/RlpB